MFLIVVFCNAQDTTLTKADSAGKKSPLPGFRLFTYGSGYSFRQISSHDRNSKSEGFNFGKMSWKPGYADRFFLPLDYGSLITKASYNYIVRPDFYYHYDPANPYGARDPFEGIINGSLDYLLWKLFEEK